MGRGIGFGTKPGRDVTEKKIEKIFRMGSQSLADQFKELLANMPLEHAQISNDIIWERLHVALPEEAGFVALHFVNAECGTDIRDALNFPNLMKGILELVKVELKIEFYEDSLHYERFITHVKFLLQRVYRKELLDSEEQELVEMMKSKYPEEYDCSRKVAEYIEDSTDTKISEEEIMYLSIHIRRLTMAEN